MRFRKRVKIFPGFSLNFSSSGISSTIGVRGASITFGKRGAYLNTSIPALGLYSRQKISGGSSYQSGLIPATDTAVPVQEDLPITDLPGVIKSADKETLTSSNLLEMKETLAEAFKDKIELREEITKAERQLKTAKIIQVIASILIIGFVIKFFRKNVQEKKDYVVDLQQQLAACKVDIDITLDGDFKDKYDVVKRSFEELTTAGMIWDVTSQVDNDAVATRSAATASITRRKVNFRLGDIEIIKSTFMAMHLENANGDDLYIYPAFVIVTKNKTDFGLIDLKELQVNFATVKFLEQENIPHDTQTVGETWAKVNKNGQPDKRFKDNYRIPIVKYGQVELTTKVGLNEAYCISDHDKGEMFVNAFQAYKESIRN